MTLDQPFLAALLQGKGLESARHAQAEKLLAIFLDVCAALAVSDPADPLAPRIARTLITIASEGESDPDTLYERTLFQCKTHG
jgi:hypothetical protein